MRKYTKYILLLPCSLFLIITLGFGIGNSLLQSLGFIPSIGLNNFTLDSYIKLFNDKSFISSFVFTLKFSFISSIISLIIGTVLAYLLHVKCADKKLSFLKFPIIIPHVIVVLIIITIFSKSGLISRILYNIGIINDLNDFPLLINDSFGIGIILTYIWKETPFITLIIFGIISKIPKEIFYSAKNLGANSIYIFLHIVIPICKKGILTSFLIIFSFSFSSFETPYLIGATVPKSLAVKAYIEYSSADIFNRPYAMAINIFIIFISLILLLLYAPLYKNSLKEEI